MLQAKTIPGFVRDGVIVPATSIARPNGSEVNSLIGRTEPDSHLAEELAAWDAASNETWAMIERWEAAASVGVTAFRSFS